MSDSGRECPRTEDQEGAPCAPCAPGAERLGEPGVEPEHPEVPARRMLAASAKDISKPASECHSSPTVCITTAPTGTAAAGPAQDTRRRGISAQAASEANPARRQGGPPIPGEAARPAG